MLCKYKNMWFVLKINDNWRRQMLFYSRRKKVNLWKHDNA